MIVATALGPSASWPDESKAALETGLRPHLFSSIGRNLLKVLRLSVVRPQLLAFVILGILLAPGLVPINNVDAHGHLPSWPPAPDYSLHMWDEYTSREGRFRIRFPGKPEEFISTTDGNVLEHQGLLKYRVSYSDDKVRTSAHDLLEARRSEYLEAAKAAKQPIVKANRVVVEGHPGYFLHVQGAGFIRIQEFVVGDRLYALVVEGRKALPNELGGENDFERLAMNFIDSFKLIR